jgi:hypothetical protein
MIFGYDDILKLGGSQHYRPNGWGGKVFKDVESLKELDPYHFLFEKKIKHDVIKFEKDLCSSLIKEQKNFVYPIMMKQKSDFKSLSNDSFISIPQEVVDYVRMGAAKFVIFYPLEGDFDCESDIDNLNNFTTKHELLYKDVYFVNNNLKLESTISQNSIKFFFKIINFNYFLSNPWFIEEDISDLSMQNFFQQDIDRKIKYVTTYKKAKKFISLNRRPRKHRVILFTEVMKTPELEKNFFMSMGSEELESGEVKNKNVWKSYYYSMIGNSYKFNKSSGIEFLENYDIKDTKFIDANPEFNLAFNLNETLQLNSFVNVVTETLYSKDQIFLSEKIFKPIYTAQPFIVLGNPNTLTKLKELGFKTFDKWWDESYDNEIDFQKRLEKIMEVIFEINSKSHDELLDITREMEDVLTHNYNNFIETCKTEMLKLKSLLGKNFNKEIH